MARSLEMGCPAWIQGAMTGTAVWKRAKPSSVHSMRRSGSWAVIVGQQGERAVVGGEGHGAGPVQDGHDGSVEPGVVAAWPQPVIAADVHQAAILANGRGWPCAVGAEQRRERGAASRRRR